MWRATYDFAEELWNGTQRWLFESIAQPILLALGLGGWLEDAYRATEAVMLGCVQVLVILLLFRPLEALWPAERWDDRKFTRVDIVYTLLNKLGVVPLAVFVALQPLVDVLDETVRDIGILPPRVEHLFPILIDKHLITFVIYFMLYDLAGYWVHRAQHGLHWWWALHSVHHTQSQMSCWSDDRNHVMDDLVVGAVMAFVAVLVGVQPTEFVGILVASRLLESFSHVNAPIGFGRLGERLLVSPRYHRLHHARASRDEPHIHDHNFAAVLPIWDIFFGTAIFEPNRIRPTGVDNAENDRDNGRSWLGQQTAGIVRLARVLLPTSADARAANS